MDNSSKIPGFITNYSIPPKLEEKKEEPSSKEQNLPEDKPQASHEDSSLIEKKQDIARSAEQIKKQVEEYSQNEEKTPKAKTQLTETKKPQGMVPRSVQKKRAASCNMPFTSNIISGKVPKELEKKEEKGSEKEELFENKKDIIIEKKELKRKIEDKEQLQGNSPKRTSKERSSSESKIQTSSEKKQNTFSSSNITNSPFTNYSFTNVNSLSSFIPKEASLPDENNNTASSISLTQEPFLFAPRIQPHVNGPTTSRVAITNQSYRSDKIISAEWSSEIPKNETVDTTKWAQDLSDSKIYTLLTSATIHLGKRIELFGNLCEAFSGGNFMGEKVKGVIALPNRNKNVKAEHYFGFGPQKPFQRAHISILPTFNILHENGELKELSDEQWYRTLNAVDLVNSCINRIDDEIESKGREKACGLLSKVCRGILTPDQAKKELSEHVKTVLLELCNAKYLTSNWKDKEKQLGERLAKQLITQWDTIPQWRSLVVQGTVQDEKKDGI